MVLSLQRNCRRYIFWNPGWLRREQPRREKSVANGDISILRSIQNLENSVQRMPQILDVNIPWGTVKRSISSPSPNSWSMKRYDIQGTIYYPQYKKLTYHDEGDKILMFSIQFFYFACLEILARDSQRSCPGSSFGATFFYLHVYAHLAPPPPKGFKNKRRRS